MDAEPVVAAVIAEVYGYSDYSKALIEHLVEKLPEWEGLDRKREIMLACWNFFPGGSTAEYVAERIEGNLSRLEAEDDAC